MTEDAQIHQEYILEEIREERRFQDKKWGSQNHNTLPEWMMILGEEFGEACQAACDINFRKNNDQFLNKIKHFREEVIQTAAVCVKILENLDPLVAKYGEDFDREDD